MGKRASLGGKNARPAKAAKVEDEHSLLSQLLAGEKTMPKECKDMLLRSVPHAFKSTPADRHEFEIKVVQSIDDICTERETKLNTDVETVRAEVAEVEQKKVTAASDHENAKNKASAKTDAKAAKLAVKQEAEQAVATAESTVEAVASKRQESEKAKQLLVDQKTEREETVAQIWEPLKNSVFPGSWQQRNKAIVKMTGLLESIGAPAALTAALLLALKQKVDAREGFAKKTVEHAELILQESVTQLNAKVETADADIAGLPKEEEAAAATLTSAESKLQQADTESMAAENEWAEEESAAVKAQDAVTSLEFQAEDAEKSLNKAQTALSTFLELKSKIEAFRDHRAAAADDTMEVEAEDTASPAKVASPAKAAETTVESEVA